MVSKIKNLGNPNISNKFHLNENTNHSGNDNQDRKIKNIWVDYIKL